MGSSISDIHYLSLLVNELNCADLSSPGLCLKWKENKTEKKAKVGEMETATGRRVMETSEEEAEKENGRGKMIMRKGRGGRETEEEKPSKKLMIRNGGDDVEMGRQDTKLKKRNGLEEIYNTHSFFLCYYRSFCSPSPLSPSLVFSKVLENSAE